jgi:AcrR family transcriptional regulator
MTPTGLHARGGHLLGNLQFDAPPSLRSLPLADVNVWLKCLNGIARPARNPRVRPICYVFWMVRTVTKLVAKSDMTHAQSVRTMTGLRKGAARNPKGRVRVESILDAARHIIVLKGYSNFTMRKVAAKAGISLGNLQYYFIDKSALLRELLTYLNRRYDEDYAMLEAAAGGDRGKHFSSFINYLLEDDRKPLVRGLFLQFWALSSNDEYISRVMESGYKHYRNAISAAVKAVNPALDKSELRARAMLIQAVVEGAAFALQNRSGVLVPPRGLFKHIRREAMRIARRSGPKK